MKKSSPKRDKIVDILRTKIIFGKFKQGQRLPSFIKMEELFQTSKGTLKEAVKVLKNQGFIYSKDRSGLYVSTTPPHTSRIGLLFRQPREKCLKNLFYKSLYTELERHNYTFANKKIAIYHNISPETNSPELQKLQQDIKDNCLAGLIFTEELFKDVRKSFLILKPDINYVYIFGKKKYKQLPSVDVNNYQLWKKGLNYLRNSGCQRIAVIDKIEGISFLKSEKNTLAPDIPSRWLVTAPVSSPGSTEDLIALLLDYPAEQRPNALFIGNDNFIAPTLNVLKKRQLKPNEDIILLTHSNWPERIKIPANIKGIGFHTSQILENCIKALTLPRVVIPEIQYAPAVFGN